MTRALFIAALTGIAIIFWVLYLYRKGRLKEDYALLWLIMASAIVVTSFLEYPLAQVTWLLGLESTSDVMFASFIALLLIACIYFSMEIALLSKQNEKFVQEIAILKMRLENALKMNKSKSKDA